MLRIGILGHTFVNWAGGLDFVRTVASSLQASGAPLELHLLLPIDGPWLHARTRLRAWRDGLKSKPVATQPSRAHLDAAIASFGPGITVHGLDIGARALRAKYRELNLDALLPALKPLPLGPDMPWVGYVYDFQHRHLPQLFKPRQIARRERSFVQMLDKARSVIVNAQAVADDIRRFIPQARAEVFALPFGPQPDPAWFDLPAPPLERIGMSTSQPYFIVCNQFWQHKDHATAWRALAELQRSHPQVHLVCTGDTSDFRDMNYFPLLMAMAEQLGIAPRLHVLGLVPKREQIAWLRGARALVQPTLSEGGPGGGAAYDAVSLGVPALLSDIAVNREIVDADVRFFRVGDAGDLAAKMREALDSSPAARLDPAALIALGRERRAACGQVLLRAIDATRHQ
ncbi:MAG: glycosyltransferase [Burkholderiaceae bacterium]|nr:glycosyltransferase [Burkholderiaceae bacterium]